MQFLVLFCFFFLFQLAPSCPLEFFFSFTWSSCLEKEARRGLWGINVFFKIKRCGHWAYVWARIWVPQHIWVWYLPFYLMIFHFLSCWSLPATKKENRSGIPFRQNAACFWQSRDDGGMLLSETCSLSKLVPTAGGAGGMVHLEQSGICALPCTFTPQTDVAKHSSSLIH